LEPEGNSTEILTTCCWFCVVRLLAPASSAPLYLFIFIYFFIHLRLDEWGAMFNSTMTRAGVDVERVVAKEGATGRCCILSSEGQRTMRTCLDGAARLQPQELRSTDFEGSKIVYLSGCENYYVIVNL